VAQESADFAVFREIVVKSKQLICQRGRLGRFGGYCGFLSGVVGFAFFIKPSALRDKAGLPSATINLSTRDWRSAQAYSR